MESYGTSRLVLPCVDVELRTPMVRSVELDDGTHV